ncbi:hypothetical protein RD792_000467 [Penstemon davidsonii]|uniref:Late embryogenesis abundant protein n=1 Tax=Penstemon davidsonii TaxID=160366 RepID=A0ABR0DLZ3_9LAMI|nr:hypothetical protein RD792_000467 [Penstemon davidsonii]
MAANLQQILGFGKSLVKPFTIIPNSLSLALRRSVHGSVYEKNPEDLVQSTVVPDHVIHPLQPDQYWAPHPQTGVFGPAKDHNPASGGESGFHASASEDSVLEQKAFFRPLEDLDKPEVHP